MTTKLWVISDCHRHHRGMMKHGHRQPGYEEVLDANWRNLVSPEDVVIDLGDVILGQNSKLTEIMKALPGRKILCRGNHDARPTWFLSHGYDFACDYFIYRGICFSHKPMIPLPPRARVCLHGHYHLSTHRSQFYERHPYYAEHRERYVLVEIESCLSPRLLENVVDMEWARSLAPVVPQIDPELDAEETDETSYRRREYARIAEERDGA